MSTVFLIGRPVGHSLSPAMHNAAFKELGLPHEYRTLEVADADLRETVERFRSDDVLGANVTIPHKESTMKIVDDVDGEARRIGAVNTIVKHGSRLVGSNTDAYGFESAISVPVAGSPGGILIDQDVLLLGAGGAARACLPALLDRGNTVRVANRNIARAQELVRAIQVNGRRASVVDFPTRQDDLAGITGIVNATPLGMHGEDPLAGLLIREGLHVVDLVPIASATPLVKRARGVKNVDVVDGLSMLLHQAARSFQLWTGMEAPLEVMRAALPRPA